jgi:hypothetical protein
MNPHPHLSAALAILAELGLPRAQLNERSALCLLALLDLDPGKQWKQAGNPLIGITPIMDWAKTHYGADYAPNTRETFRRQTMHQFVAAGIALYNPDDPTRAVNSPRAVYQIEVDTRALLKTWAGRGWKKHLGEWLKSRATLTERYARARGLKQVPVQLGKGKLKLSPGAHSQLIKAIVEVFAPRFAPGSVLIYAGDTGRKWAHFDETRLHELGVTIDAHGKMPDVVLYDTQRDWLLLVESVTSHGPVDGKRRDELAALFAHATPGLVYVTAFPDRTTYRKYSADVAWETEVWIADAPEHMIHFNGSRFLGPYAP